MKTLAITSVLHLLTFLVGFHSSHYSLRLYKVCCSLSTLLSASKSAFFSIAILFFFVFHVSDGCSCL